MSVFQSQAWADSEQRFRRILLAVWIAFVVGGFFVVAAGHSVVMSYVLEEMTTHSAEGLILKRYVLPTSEEYPLFMGYMVSTVVAIGLAAGVLSRIVLGHWRTWVLMAVIGGIPIAVAIVLAMFWFHEAPELFDWGFRQLAILSIPGALASVGGVLLGKPASKLLVRLIVPPRLRPFFSQVGEPNRPARPSQPRATQARPHYWSEKIRP